MGNIYERLKATEEAREKVKQAMNILDNENLRTCEKAEDLVDLLDSEIKCYEKLKAERGK